MSIKIELLINSLGRMSRNRVVKKKEKKKEKKEDKHVNVDKEEKGPGLSDLSEH